MKRTIAQREAARHRLIERLHHYAKTHARYGRDRQCWRAINRARQLLDAAAAQPRPPAE